MYIKTHTKPASSSFIMKKRSKYVENRVLWKLHFNKYKFEQFNTYYFLKSICSGFFVRGLLLCHISSLSRKIFRKYLQKKSRFVIIAEFFEKLWYYSTRDSIVLRSACIEPDVFNVIIETKYSRMDLVKFIEDSL